MYRLVTVVLIIFLTHKLNYLSGYQWIPLEAGDPIPEHAIIIDFELETYVGRARHFHTVLPAEIHNKTNSYALITSCSEHIVKEQFEILVAQENCRWVRFNPISDIRANVVRAGTSKNGELIFVGKTKNVPLPPQWDSYSQKYIEDETNSHIASILLTSNEVKKWDKTNDPVDQYFLSCEDKNKWIDSSSALIPNNTISGGKSEYGEEIFVARILEDCKVVSGQVIPTLGIATALYKGEELESKFCQVLVGDADKYEWVSAKQAEIPDYAVVAGKYDDEELMYVARVNNTVGYILYSEGLNINIPYEILVSKLE